VVADVEGVVDRDAGHDAVRSCIDVRSIRRSNGRNRGRGAVLAVCSGVSHRTHSARLAYWVAAYWRNPQREHLTIGTRLPMVAGARRRVIGPELALPDTAGGVRADGALNTEA
jgi:hypothetical protein